MHVLPIFERYLRSIIAISRNESLLKRICGFQNGIMAAEAEEEEETLALLADPTHMQMSELELIRALQSDRDGGQEERY